MNPAKDFRLLIKKKSLPFGEGEDFFSPFFSVCIIKYCDSCSVLANCVSLLFACGDPRVLPSLSATDWEDRAVAWQQEHTVLHEKHHLYPGL